MSRKTVCMLSQEPEIKDLIDKIVARNTQTDAEIDFLRKRAMQTSEKASEEIKSHWKAVFDICKKRNLLPAGFEFDHPNHHLGFDLELDLIISNVLEGNQEHPEISIRQLSPDELPPEVLNALISHLKPNPLH